MAENFQWGRMNGQPVHLTQVEIDRRRSSAPSNVYPPTQRTPVTNYSPQLQSQQSTERRPSIAISQLTTPVTSSTTSVPSLLFPSTTTAAPPRRKGASKEVYGFICWITTFVAYGSYILWAYLPEHILKSMGVYYYPKKYWAIALPTYFVVSVGFGVVVYVCWNFIHTAPLDSFNTYTDKYALGHNTEHSNEKSIPPIADIPLTLVNELLYSGDNNTNNQTQNNNIRKTLSHSTSLQANLSSPSSIRLRPSSSVTLSNGEDPITTTTSTENLIFKRTSLFSSQ